MAELKTKATKESAVKFLKSIESEEKRADSLTGQKAVMWGTSIVGFGMYHYESERSAQKGDWPLVGFSPRKQNLTLYVMHGNDGDPLLKKLGKHKTSGGSCLYIKTLSDVDLKVLQTLIKRSYQYMQKHYS